jgi:hypothetical protein
MADEPEPKAMLLAMLAVAPLPRATLLTPVDTAAGPIATLSCPVALLSARVEFLWNYLMPVPLLTRLLTV